MHFSNSLQKSKQILFITDPGVEPAKGSVLLRKYTAAGLHACFQRRRLSHGYADKLAMNAGYIRVIATYVQSLCDG